MPRFYFNLRDDLSADDPEGLELPGLDAARAHAETFARDLAAEGIRRDGKLTLDHRIEVTDETGQDVLTVRFADVVTVEG